MKIKKILLVLVLAALPVLLSGCAKQSQQTSTTETPQAQNNQENMENKTATIETSRGSFTVSLYSDKAPKTVENFVEKAKSDYYKDLTFHRVEDWVVQGGDPLGNGTGGGDMATELNDAPFKEGSVGVARGADVEISNDSQFFICTEDCSWLTGQYTNFGEVTEGMDTVKSIQIGDKILSISIN